MSFIKSVLIDGEKIHIFNSALYLFESYSGCTLNLDVIVSEVALKKYHNKESLIVEIELKDGRVISSFMFLKTVPGGLPQLNLFCELDDPDEYSDLLRVHENDSEFPRIEEGITLEDIRKVEMPNEKVTVKLTLPINQVEWLKSQKARELNKIVNEMIERYWNEQDRKKESETK
ncbi:hypothetical protein [Bacillus sp. B15-48]|uniref:hypothetical protein n=1 Tax=Bacillus sp. B15-48 TaxID=1548601 RepID=UPI00193F726F|nr:hypothetical protein [Bacillus sp. B15-48]MBM4761024.1 hypothetical protein [Bacillus sp. B15-48]